MEIAVLGSGSSGNATIVRSAGTAILLEAGLSAKQITLRARAAGFDPDSIAAVFVSHAHSDHVAGAPVFSRRRGVPVFMTDAAHEEWLRACEGRLRRAGRRSGAASRGDADADRGEDASRHGVVDGGLGAVEGSLGCVAGGAEGDLEASRLAWSLSDGVPHSRPVSVAESPGLFAAAAAESGLNSRVSLEESGTVQIGSLRVRSFPLPHDGSGTVGYTVEADGIRFGYVTDLGHVTALVVERLKGCDALLIEMNHDPDLLREGPYPWEIKQRIASRHGHLSNEQGSSLLEQVMGPDTRAVFLGHLSETNNQPGIALAAARLAAERAGRPGLSLLAAEPHRPSGTFKL